MTAGDGERYLTRAEAAELLRVSERTVDRLSAPDGPLPRRKLGRLVRFREADVRALLDDRNTTRED